MCNILGSGRTPGANPTFLRLVELLNSTRDDGTESMDRVRVKYEEFSRILHVRQFSPVDVPKSYLELLKLAGQVRRPFHSQAVALISLCRTLVTEFEKDAHRTSDNLDALEKCVDCDSPPFWSFLDALSRSGL